eukprot:COSAG02_NODE_1435_length_12610_cov_7.021181_1_plen_117_part_00
MVVCPIAPTPSLNSYLGVLRLLATWHWTCTLRNQERFKNCGPHLHRLPLYRFQCVANVGRVAVFFAGTVGRRGMPLLLSWVRVSSKRGSIRGCIRGCGRSWGCGGALLLLLLRREL